MLWDGEIGALSGLRHDEMAADLADDAPARLCECFARFFAGDVRKRTHASSLQAVATDIVQAPLWKRRYLMCG